MADQRLINLLGGPALSALRKRLRLRFEQAQTEGIVDSFRIDRLSEVEYDALAQLQGLPSRLAQSISVDVAFIDTALRNAGIALSLKDALERLDGPIVHIRTARIRTATAWAETISVCTHDGLTAFLGTVRGLALLKRLSKQSPANATHMIQCACAVLHRLPAGGVPRALLAAESLGTPHALDQGQPVATLVLSVWRTAADPLVRNIEDLQGQEESVRDTWARAGVLVNELARPALFLNLPMVADAVSGPATGEPDYLSLRTLLRAPPTWLVAGRDVFVCENPNLLAIVADRLGVCSAPLVCTDGMPSAAQQVLLTQLARAGANLRYHGDFDWPGIRIGNFVQQSFGARPWRFSAPDYIAAVQTAWSVRHKLEGAEADALWDNSLTTAMRKYQLLISEENVVDQLLQDLRLGSTSSPAMRL
jgi:uncharacterized protein (TIGR02679 family)